MRNISKQNSSTSNFSDSRPLVQNKVKNVASYLAIWLAVPTFWKSHGYFIMLSFSIKPLDQTNETEKVCLK